MNRISSLKSGDASDESLGSLSISEYSPKVELESVYLYTLRLLVLEYINKPQFKQNDRNRQSPPTPPSSSSSSSSYSSLHSSRWSLSSSPLEDSGRSVSLGLGKSLFSNGQFSRSTNKTNYSEHIRIMTTLKQRLATYLYDVTIGRKKVTNATFRRCLLKFNNDTFMNSSLSTTLENMSNVEELIVYFTKSANNELSKVVVGDIQKELFKQVSKFVGLLQSLLPTNTPASFINKLTACADRMKPTKPSLKQKLFSNEKRRSATPVMYETSDSSSMSAVRKPVAALHVAPSFKLDDIPYSNYFSEIFNTDSIKVQQDVIKVMKESTNFTFSRELDEYSFQLQSDGGFLFLSDFRTEEEYNSWKILETKEIELLKNEFRTIGRAPSVPNSKNLIMPSDPRSTFVMLMNLIIKKECSTNMSSMEFTPGALYFMNTAARYWRVDFPSTLAALFYTASNISVLHSEEINLALTEGLFTFIKSTILHSDAIVDTRDWNEMDRRQWNANLFYTSEQCVNSLDNLLTGLYATTKPKFSPILVFYFEYVSADPSFQEHLPTIEKRIVKRLRRTIFKTSEKYYKSLIMELPKDETLEFKHIQNIAELIVRQLNTIQKRYTKPLLDKVNISFECATMLTTAMAIDGPNMIKKIERVLESKKKDVPPVDALELYSTFRELRDIYRQVQLKEKFPFNLERAFGKYLKRFAKNIALKISEVFRNSIKTETWEKINDDVRYSKSVLDIFKMANESLNIFKSFDWDINYRFAEAVVIVLKAFSDGIQLYCDMAVKLVQKSLRYSSASSYGFEDRGSSTNESEKRKSKWDFHEMKKAVRSSSSSAIPQPYKYKTETCVILNDVDTMIAHLEELENIVDFSELSKVITEHNAVKQKTTGETLKDGVYQLYTIRIKSASDIKGYGSNGLSNSSVSLINSREKSEIGETKVVPKSNNPEWDEEFELQLKRDEKCTLLLNVWHHPTGNFMSLTGADLCGRVSLVLDPKEFADDGFPNPKTLILDTRGELNMEIALETERMDPLFCIGRSYRTLSRARDKILELVVNKFTPFVSFVFSREVLKSICGGHGTRKPSDEEIYDAIVPLFDYLNANLNVLGQELSHGLLFMVMLKGWLFIIKAADIMLLPQVDIAKHRLANARKSLWSIGSSNSVSGYGRALTEYEIDCIFKWLDALCVDFFYNQGEGPPLKALQNTEYQTLLLIPSFYKKSALELKSEVKRLNPLYFQNIAELTSGSNVAVSRRFTTVERRKTIMGNSSKGKRKQLQEELQKADTDSLQQSLSTLNIILRVLITKGETDYVYRQLHERKQKMKRINVASSADKVSKGQKINYRS
ncbi:uncharacterized protein KNAG_0G03050 [Huiozyma naganishii CBS 8797]|uniref:C2 domain-containing protein n=1 Tax=Huiozyma naganishii (strain ATCC MYA-139 / BCRC 22969 / CBS 8797 / KCTC 17520 / NBRC 10181 / NCYC 3082 / Yp74L-3) TaxID=1071383 RepID=J7S198_HUIN7|nr:hypothetical protein KNAG_0G03050 [Kazachstania naganishii CBS 8797]CCK71362.1 hypothetical protein KNAG_0G03050 [Kazachstania naganishii CBS 8797]